MRSDPILPARQSEEDKEYGGATKKLDKCLSLNDNSNTSITADHSLGWDGKSERPGTLSTIFHQSDFYLEPVTI